VIGKPYRRSTRMNADRKIKTFNHKGHEGTRREIGTSEHRGIGTSKALPRIHVINADRKSKPLKRGGKEEAEGAETRKRRDWRAERRDHRRGRRCHTSIELSHRRFVGDRQGEDGFTAGAVRAVGKLEKAAVGFSDLAAQDEADAAAAVFGGEEGHEKIVAVEQAGALVADEDLNAARVGAPADFPRPDV